MSSTKIAVTYTTDHDATDSIVCEAETDDSYFFGKGSTKSEALTQVMIQMVAEELGVEPSEYI